MTAVINVENLHTQFETDHGIVKAVDGVSFHVDENEIIGVVGESGCGKSVTMLSVIQLIQSPPGKIINGKVIFEGHNLLDYKAKGSEMRSVRGGKIAMIFQEPMTSLNPVLTICQQMTESTELHLGLSHQASRERAIELLKMVGVPESENRIDDYPHQFSGGMRQRVMIAMALSCSPKMMIADEPTTALDVTTQAQLLELMQGMIEQFKSSLVIVTHNLGVVARYARRIYVMYAGKVVESGFSEDVFSTPRHPYTVGLLRSVPRLGDKHGSRKLVPIDGLPPNLISMPPTCAFLPRCAFKTEKCANANQPELRLAGNQHYTACHIDIQEKR
jgi:peptide/nickel transport system ATP-binding protein